MSMADTTTVSTMLFPPRDIERTESSSAKGSVLSLMGTIRLTCTRYTGKKLCNV